MKPWIQPKLRGWLVHLPKKLLFYVDLESANARIADYYNKKRRFKRRMQRK